MRIAILPSLPLLLALGCGAAVDEEARSPHATTQPTHTEVEISVAQLPAAVIAALAGKGDIREAEMIVSQRGTVYEVEIGKTEYLLDADGTILAQQQDDEDDDEDSDSDSDEAEGDDD